MPCRYHVAGFSWVFTDVRDLSPKLVIEPARSLYYAPFVFSSWITLINVSPKCFSFLSVVSYLMCIYSSCIFNMKKIMLPPIHGFGDPRCQILPHLPHGVASGGCFSLQRIDAMWIRSSINKHTDPIRLQSDQFLSFHIVLLGRSWQGS